MALGLFPRLKTLVVASVASVAAVAAASALPSVAEADVQHVVGRGHTIEAIATRYHVTSRAIVEANHLKDVKHLHIGDALTIPGVNEKTDGTKAKTEAHDDQLPSRGKGEKIAKVGKTNGRETTTFAMKAKTPGVIHVHRLATTEQYDIHVGNKRGRVSPTALKAFEKMMRSPAGMAHPVDGRLVTLLGIVSNHFGSRKLEVVSGFRPFTPSQFNPHSNHMHGRAIDFRVTGVPNEAVRDFCRTLKNVGCGYYPNSVFVHMDVREQNAFWIDYSRPGEAPRYNAPNLDADEGTSDVHDDGQSASSGTSGASPEMPAPSSDAPAATASAATASAPALATARAAAPAAPAVPPATPAVAAAAPATPASPHR